MAVKYLFTTKKQRTNNPKGEEYFRKRSEAEAALTSISPVYSPSSSTPVNTSGYRYTATPDAYLPDSVYNDQLGLIQAKLNDTIASSTNSENELANIYGVNFNRDTAGNIVGTSIAQNVDVTSPFSKASLLKKFFNRDTKSTMNSYAGMGQYGSGAYEEMQKQNKFNYEQGNDALQRNFRSALQGIIERRRAAEQLAAEEKLAAEQALLQRQLDARDTTGQVTGGDILPGTPYDSRQNLLDALKNIKHEGAVGQFKQQVRRRGKRNAVYR